MSLTSALSNALSGLSVASRGVQIVSQNVANAQTEGYSKRELVLSSQLGTNGNGGVRIEGVQRRIDTALLSERRGSQASLADAETQASGRAQIEALFGDPTQAGSLTQKISQFSGDLISAASRPDSLPRQELAAQSAAGLASKINEIADGIQSLRQDADQAIAKDVETLNQSLSQIAELDDRIARLGHGSRDISGLLDERQAMVDTIASIVPVREVPSDDGKIALFTTGGAVLYNSRPAIVEFSTHPSIQADLSLSAGDLSPVTISGIDYSADENASRIKGGSLYANILVRDQIAPDAQADIDALSRDLIDRFQDTGLDTSLSAGDPGLFSDGFGSFDATDEVGIANRIQLNQLVDPEANGEVWRLRDGLGALTEGDSGQSGLLNSLQERLGTVQAAVSGSLSGKQMTVSEFAGETLSLWATASYEADRVLTFESTQFDTLKEAELRNGVDTDEEMRDLLVLEQAYAANARVISTLDELLTTLIRM